MERVSGLTVTAFDLPLFRRNGTSDAIRVPAMSKDDGGDRREAFVASVRTSDLPVREKLRTSRPTFVPSLV